MNINTWTAMNAGTLNIMLQRSSLCPSSPTRQYSTRAATSRAVTPGITQSCATGMAPARDDLQEPNPNMLEKHIHLAEKSK